MLTIRPQQTGANAQTFNLSNIHGDVFATLDATGTVLGTTQTGPFGETINGQALPLNGATGVSYSYVGKHLKATETQLTIKPMQMGARVYLPNIGRFASVDPVQGGTPNPYTYVTDPVNDFDLSGQWSLKNIVKSVKSTAKNIGKSFAKGKSTAKGSSAAIASPLAPKSTFDFKSLKPDKRYDNINKAPATGTNSSDLSGSICIYLCIEGSLNSKAHSSFSLGLGPDVGANMQASVSPGEAAGSGWSYGASCDAGFIGINRDSTGTSFGMNVVPSKIGCNVHVTKTW